MPKVMPKILALIIAGIVIFLIFSIVGGVIAFNTFIKPNLATVTQPVAEISQPIVAEGEKIVQEGLEQGQQEASNILSEIIQANITAVREQLISAFTIGGGEESEQE